MPTLDREIFNEIMGLIALEGNAKLKKAYIDLVIKLGRAINIADLDMPTSQAMLLKESYNCARSKAAALRIYEECQKRNISVICAAHPFYPLKLKNIYNPPSVLFVMGELSNLAALDCALAIVGSRKADNFGCEFASECANFMASRNCPIVSGLAYGIDTSAHKGALKSRSGFPTIAVLGNGLNSIYPARNEKLAREILQKKGLLISQFRPDAHPNKFSFLDRNRVIAGLSDAVLVVQAPQRSGSLATASYALEEGRDVLVVPGAVNDYRYEGSLKLIKSGAHLISEKTDLLNFFPQASESNLDQSESPQILSTEAQSIVAILKKESRIHIDKLSAIFQNPKHFAQTLIELELSGILVQEPGNFIRLSSTA